MIQFEKLENRISLMRRQFEKSKPFPHIVIDEFLDPSRIDRLVEDVPDPEAANIRQSRDYIFARNKYEKSMFEEFSRDFSDLYSDLTSDRFAQLLSDITGENVFIDPNFHGGGLHQGGEGSFLDMHADFNFHPLHEEWFRNLNVLIYLNDGWKPEFGGELKLRHKDTGAQAVVEPLLNRCVIMFTRDYTLHGYDPISFPPGRYRRSIAAYAYSVVSDSKAIKQSTTWYPERGGAIKRMIGRWWPKLVRVKNSVLGSSTAKNS